MKPKFSFLCAFLITMCVVNTQAASPPDIGQVKSVARTCFAAANLPQYVLPLEDYFTFSENVLPVVESVTSFQSSGEVCLYLVNFSNPKGWIILPNDMELDPVLAYGFNRNIWSFEDFVADRFLFEMYADEVQYAKMYPDEDSPTKNVFLKKWDYAERNVYVNPIHRDTIVNTSCYEYGDILLKKNNQENLWSQIGNNGGCNSGDCCDYSYNKHCPTTTSAGYCGKSPVGCTAVAVAQVMWYWEHPRVAIVNNQTHNYYWDDMPPRIECSMPMNYVDNVTWLLRDVGHSIGTVYLINSSACPLTSVRLPLINKFGYSDVCDYSSLPRFRDNKKSQRLRNAIIGDILNCRPVIYQAWHEERLFDAHTFVIDGYRKDGTFHINLGWGINSVDYPASVTWYTLPNMCSYNRTVSILHNIRPDRSRVYPKNAMPMADNDDKMNICALNVDYFSGEQILSIGSSSEIVSTTIYNLAGTKILVSTEKRIDVSMLPKGTYIAVTDDGIECITSKIVKL